MKTAVVTGASGGIGLETARALLADGWQVVCLSRHACPLEGVRSIPCDITDSAQVQAAFAAVDRVDLLVNNAGFGISGAVECTGEAEMRRQFDLNFFAWVTVIQAALPALRESRGRILNISSAAAVFSIPFQSFYSATKAAVESLTCALRSELVPFGITVGALRDVRPAFPAGSLIAPQTGLDGARYSNGMFRLNYRRPFRAAKMEKAGDSFLLCVLPKGVTPLWDYG